MNREEGGDRHTRFFRRLLRPLDRPFSDFADPDPCRCRTTATGMKISLWRRRRIMSCGAERRSSLTSGMIGSLDHWIGSLDWIIGSLGIHAAPSYRVILPVVLHPRREFSRCVGTWRVQARRPPIVELVRDDRSPHRIQSPWGMSLDADIQGAMAFLGGRDWIVAAAQLGGYSD